MNYSPINDPDFLEFREKARKEAAKKRRRRALILLSTISLVLAICCTLLGLAAKEALPGWIQKVAGTDKTEVSSSLLPSDPTSDPSSLPENPSVSAPTSIPSEEPTPTPTPEPTPTPTPSPTIPQNMHVTTVYVDAGHGYTASDGTFDRGAGEGSEYYRLSLEKTGVGLYEADMNLQISLRVKELLLEKGYRVIMSREDYVDLPLSINKRAFAARDSGADLLVSIHGNSAAPGAYGARVFYCDERGDSLAYARAVADAIDKAGATRKTTTLNDGNNLAMCNAVGMPSVLVETCFLTNTEDAEMALTDEWIESMAQAIVAGICKQYPCKTTFQ